MYILLYIICIKYIKFFYLLQKYLKKKNQFIISIINIYNNNLAHRILNYI